MTENQQPVSHQNDRYRLHRLALSPLRSRGYDSGIADNIEAVGSERFSAFVQSNGLQQVWREFLDRDAPAATAESWKTTLYEHARLTAAHQMIQNKAIAEWAEALNGLNLDWFLFKGVDLRGWLYPDPVLRPVSDIDLSIRPADRERVIDWAKRAGYAVVLDRATRSHEITLARGHVSIDLHWQLFRPGRARPGLNGWLFDHRTARSDHTGLDATASLLVMLVHPAITKYLISPTSILIHMVDQARLIQGEGVDWQSLSQALGHFGLRTAAWSSLYVLRDFTGIEAPGAFMERIQPGTVKRAWLTQWIDRAWITRWFEHRWLVAGFFSLALQDGMNDVLRAWWLRKKHFRLNNLAAQP